MKGFWIKRILKGIVFFSLIITVLGYVVMGLWNWLMPSLFAGIHTLDFPHAIGLLVLSKILFGLGKGGFGHHHGGPPWARGGMYMKKKWEEKLSHMSPEERERFKASVKNRCRTWGFNPEENFNPAAPPPAGDTKM